MVDNEDKHAKSLVNVAGGGQWQNPISKLENQLILARKVRKYKLKMLEMDKLTYVADS